MKTGSNQSPFAVLGQAGVHQLQLQFFIGNFGDLVFNRSGGSDQDAGLACFLTRKIDAIQPGGLIGFGRSGPGSRCCFGCGRFFCSSFGCFLLRGGGRFGCFLRCRFQRLAHIDQQAVVHRRCRVFGQIGFFGFHNDADLVRMTEMANPGYPVRFNNDTLLPLIRAFKTVQVIHDSGRCFFDSKGFVVFDGPIGFNIDGDTFFQRCGTDRSYPGGRGSHLFFRFRLFSDFFRWWLRCGCFCGQFAAFGK